MEALTAGPPSPIGNTGLVFGFCASATHAENENCRPLTYTETGLDLPFTSLPPAHVYGTHVAVSKIDRGGKREGVGAEAHVCANGSHNPVVASGQRHHREPQDRDCRGRRPK